MQLNNILMNLLLRRRQTESTKNLLEIVVRQFQVKVIGPFMAFYGGSLNQPRVYTILKMDFWHFSSKKPVRENSTGVFAVE